MFHTNLELRNSKLAYSKKKSEKNSNPILKKLCNGQNVKEIVDCENSFTNLQAGDNKTQLLIINLKS